jgi:hypothetical protein
LPTIIRQRLYAFARGAETRFSTMSARKAIVATPSPSRPRSWTCSGKRPAGSSTTLSPATPPRTCCRPCGSTGSPPTSWPDSTGRPATPGPWTPPRTRRPRPGSRGTATCWSALRTVGRYWVRRGRWSRLRALAECFLQATDGPGGGAGASVVLTREAPAQALTPLPVSSPPSMQEAGAGVVPRVLVAPTTGVAVPTPGQPIRRPPRAARSGGFRRLTRTCP